MRQRRRNPLLEKIPQARHTPKRRGRPWIVYSLSCRRGEHLVCPHATEQVGSHSRYFVYCTCSCHTTATATLNLIPEQTRRAIVAPANRRPAPGPSPSTAIDSDPQELLLTSRHMALQTQIAPARECSGCGIKRQVIQWMKPGYSAGPYPAWSLCALCIVRAVESMLLKNLERGSRDEQRQRKTKGANL